LPNKVFRYLCNNAFNEYQTIFGSLSTQTEINAGLNWLRLWSLLNESEPNLKKLKQSYKPKYIKLTHTISDRLQLTSSSKNIEAQLFFLETLLHNPNRSSEASLEFSALITSHINQLLRNLNPSIQPKSLSRALGLHGLHVQKQENTKAISSFTKAHSLALAIDDIELAADWEIELGRLHLKEGDRARAREYFDEAFSKIDQLRGKRQSLPPELQYQAQSKYSNYHREYQDLLFSEPVINYRKIISIQEQQKISEIENYLQCERLKTTSLLDLPQNKLPDTLIYLIGRSNMYEIILRRKNGSFYHYSIDALQLNTLLNDARKYLLSDNLVAAPASEIKSIFGNIYTLLLGKANDQLPMTGTLVWVVDTNLQNIPWEALYTPQNRYLIEQYSVSYSIGAFIDIPKSKPLKQPYILAGGISQSRENYKALPGVKSELQGISQIFPNTKILLDQNFYFDAIDKKIKSPDILHFATHGQFSRNPSYTYLVGWNGKITIQEIEKLIKQRTHPIDLVFMSACKTAAGDSRATLGISGSAIRISARSAIATLWPVNDEAMSSFSLNFYRSIKEGKNKVDSLRAAKLQALSSNDQKISNFANIFSPILIGDWD
jgi:CHAT domain-containing protein